MSVTIREYVKSKRVGYEVDIRFEWPDGSTFRRRYRAPVSTKTQALAWGRAREVEILTAGKDGPLTRSRRDEQKEVPTLRSFWPRFLEEHCRANRHKPSSIARKESAFRTWLEPLADRRLDEIGAAEISDLKSRLSSSSAKTANNVLTTLSACLKFAGPDGLRRSEGLGILATVPKIRLVPQDSDDVPEWYEEGPYRRLVDAAREDGPMTVVLILLAGDAGLRKSEIAALKWSDLDLRRRLVHVQRSIWEGKNGQKHETTPKGGKGRTIDMTEALYAALSSLPRPIQDERVFRLPGREPTDRIVQGIYRSVQRRAGLEVSGGIHRLRHTFVSRLAAAGAPPPVIQRLAGHASMATTMRYMHLAPGTMTSAIRLLDRPTSSLGETREKVSAI